LLRFSLNTESVDECNRVSLNGNDTMSYHVQFINNSIYSTDIVSVGKKSVHLHRQASNSMCSCLTEVGLRNSLIWIAMNSYDFLGLSGFPVLARSSSQLAASACI
jgi:hypothetical protein